MLRILSFLGKILGYLIVSPLTRLINWRREWIPAPVDPILHIPAIDLAEKIRKRELRSVQVVTAYIERIKVVNGVLNAVTEDRFAAALLEAAAVDKLIDSSLDERDLAWKYPLLGVPFTVKEVIGLEGMKQSIGIVARKDRKSAGDGSAAKLLKEAGAIPLCVTNTPEWSMDLETDNNITGRTKNPYDTRRTPGGSSGGEAALIGSGSSVFGIGSDVAGSCRLPNLYCGIYGLKPTPRMIDTENFFPLPEGDPRVQKYSTVGILARYSKDIRTILQIITGENAKILSLNTPVEVDQLNVFYAEAFPHTMGMTKVDKEIQELVLKVKEYLRARGAFTQKLIEKIPNINDAIEISMVRFTDVPMFNVMENEKGGNDHLWLEVVRSRVKLSKYSQACCDFEVMRRARGFVRSSKIKFWEEQGDAMEAALLDLLDDKSLILCPTFTDPAVYPTETPQKSTGIVYLVFANAFGLPAVHVPLGFNKDGLPIGIQIVAGPKMDRICLKVAEELEAEFGGWTPDQRWTK